MTKEQVSDHGSTTREAIKTAISRELMSHGKDSSGNISISEAAAEEIAVKVAASVQGKLGQPVITLTDTEVIMLAERSGFLQNRQLADQGKSGGALTIHNCETNVFPEVKKLVEVTHKYVLEKLSRGAANVEKPT